MINKVNEVSAITFSYRIDPIDGLLDKELEINFYRILQELITNIIKHSRAKFAVITIFRDHNSIHLSIEDDGVGFDYETVNNEAEGFGLSGIRERIEILKGDLTISTGAKTGTIFKIKITI